MDYGRTTANEATRPDKEAGNDATLNANGTGAFVLAACQLGLKTVMTPFAGWWVEATQNVTEAIYTPIDNPATAVAALISGGRGYDQPRTKPNPFQDLRVRQAVAKAVNVVAILQTIMRGNAESASQLVSPAMNAFSTVNADRTAFDAAGARARSTTNTLFGSW